jgi:hypothetical protein
VLQCGECAHLGFDAVRVAPLGVEPVELESDRPAQYLVRGAVDVGDSAAADAFAAPIPAPR